MFGKKRLVCSFCGKSEAEVAKLVAGPRVYICDECVALASQIMTGESGSQLPRPESRPALWRRLWGSGRERRNQLPDQTSRSQAVLG